MIRTQCDRLRWYNNLEILPQGASYNYIYVYEGVFGEFRLQLGAGYVDNCIKSMGWRLVVFSAPCMMVPYSLKVTCKQWGEQSLYRGNFLCEMLEVGACCLNTNM